MLHLVTKQGRHLMVNDRDEIIRTDIPDFKPSGQWLFRGLMPRNGPFGYSEDAAREAIRDGSILRHVGSLTYKNGTPKFLIADCDHGTYRWQGDGVVRAWITEEKPC
jgi:hypothetical protein